MQATARPRRPDAPFSSPPRRSATALAALLAAIALAGCGSTTLSRRGAEADGPDAPAPLFGRDGPPAHPPPGLELVPDAEPKVEPIRLGGANKPYEMFGTAYVPFVDDRRYDERGLASWYGRRFHGRRTSSGETYNMYAMTAAHRTLPIPSYARVRNPANGRSVIVRINDRGPFHSARLIDLSYTAALKLDLLQATSMVEVRRLTHAEILAGSWRDLPSEDAAVAAAAAAGAAAPVEAATEAAASSAAVRTPPSLVVTGLAPVAAGGGAPSRLATTGGSRADAPASDDAAPLPTGPSPAGRAFTAAARGYWVQLGAFRDPAGAETLHRRIAADLGWLAPLLAVFHESSVHRLQAGPYASRAEAQGATRRIGSALGVAPVVVERL